MSEDGSDQSPFQEKPDWVGKLKNIFQKQKEEITGLIARATGKTKAPMADADTSSMSPLAPDAAPFMSSAPPSTGEDRTFTDMIRSHWNERVKPKFTRLKKGGGDGFAPPPGPGFRWDADKINLVAILISVVLIAWTGADLAAFFVEKYIPEPPVSRVRGGALGDGMSMKAFSDYQIIVNRNLFSSLGKIPGDQVQGVPNQDNDPVKTSLPLNLIGTVILKNETRSVATIEDKGENQVYPMRIDDELPGKIKILSIEAYKVIFRNVASGRKEFVDMPEDGNGTKISVGTASSRKPPGTGIEQTAPNTFNIPRTDLDKYLSNINDVLTQARAIPHFENGQPAGYKLIQIVQGSVYEKLGLKNGDILCGVNGENINDPARAFELMNQLKTASALELCVKRDGSTTTQSYNFK